MSGLHYRDARADDAPILADLFAKAFVETFGHLYQDDDLQSFLSWVTAAAYAKELADPGFHMRIALAGEQPAGFAKLGLPSLPIETPPDTLELWQIYVMRRWQGSGVGPALYEWAERRAAERGAKHLQLTVYVDNHRARAFYERRGFTEVGRYAFMVGRQADDDRIMRKSL